MRGAAGDAEGYRPCRPSRASSAASMSRCPISAGSDEPGGVPEGTALGGCAGRLDGQRAGPGPRLWQGRCRPQRGAPLPCPQPAEPRDPDQGSAARQGEAGLLDRRRSSGDLDRFPSPATAIFPIPTKVAQLGIGLDGTTYGGVGKAPRAQVQRWTAKDEQGRPVTVMKLDWSEEFALASGVIIAYSQGEGGRQARLWATGPIRKNQPGYLPTLFALPIACGAVDGSWAVTKNPGKLNAPADARTESASAYSTSCRSRRRREPAACVPGGGKCPVIEVVASRRIACARPACPFGRVIVNLSRDAREPPSDRRHSIWPARARRRAARRPWPAAPP